MDTYIAKFKEKKKAPYNNIPSNKMGPNLHSVKGLKNQPTYKTKMTLSFFTHSFITCPMNIGTFIITTT